MIGTWVQQIAMIWLVYQLTNSAFMLGVVGFCEQFPVFVLAPFAGVYADRHDKHKTLVLLQILSAVQALLLAVLVLFHWIRIWEVLVLGAFLGIITAFEMPVRQAFVVHMVDEDKPALRNAIGLNSTIFNTSRLIGPSLAGILIAWVGEGWCFLINALSFLAVIFSLTTMRLKPFMPQFSQENILEHLRDGVRYIMDHRLMRNIILMLGTVSLLGSSIVVLAPIIAKVILHGGAHTLGWLMSASGLGAILGALYLANSRSVRRLPRIIGIAAACFGSGMIFLAMSRNLSLSLLFMFITGSGQIMSMAGSNTVLQTLAPDHMRGRIMSFYAMALRGMRPFGSLIAGALASAWGAPWALAILASTMMAGAGIYLLSIRNIRPHPASHAE